MVAAQCPLLAVVDLRAPGLTDGALDALEDECACLDALWVIVSLDSTGVTAARVAQYAQSHPSVRVYGADGAQVG